MLKAVGVVDEERCCCAPVSLVSGACSSIGAPYRLFCTCRAADYRNLCRGLIWLGRREPGAGVPRRRWAPASGAPHPPCGARRRAQPRRSAVPGTVSIGAGKHGMFCLPVCAHSDYDLEPGAHSAAPDGGARTARPGHLLDLTAQLSQAVALGR